MAQTGTFLSTQNISSLSDTVENSNTLINSQQSILSRSICIFIYFYTVKIGRSDHQDASCYTLCWLLINIEHWSHNGKALLHLKFNNKTRSWEIKPNNDFTRGNIIKFCWLPVNLSVLHRSVPLAVNAAGQWWRRGEENILLPTNDHRWWSLLHRYSSVFFFQIQPNESTSIISSCSPATSVGPVKSWVYLKMFGLL